jgi:hypothetical protein
MQVLIALDTIPPPRVAQMGDISAFTLVSVTDHVFDVDSVGP